MNGTVYATDGFGFLCLPRQYYAATCRGAIYIWMKQTHGWISGATQYQRNRAMRFLYGASCSIRQLRRHINDGKNWASVGAGKRQRYGEFFKKHGDVFALYRLPGSYGCLVFNKSYPMDTEVSLPKQTEILRILGEIRIWGANTHKVGSDNDHINRLVTWYSRNAVEKSNDNVEENRVALSDSIIRAYFSPCWNCKNCEYVCRSKEYSGLKVQESNKIRGPCRPTDITKIAKEMFYHEQTG